MALARLAAALLIIISCISTVLAATQTSPNHIRQASRENVVKRQLQPDKTRSGKRQEVSPSVCYFANGFKLKFSANDVTYYLQAQAAYVGFTDYLYPVTEASSGSLFTLTSAGVFSETDNGFIGVQIDASFVMAGPYFPSSDDLSCTLAPSVGYCPLECYNSYFGVSAGVWYTCDLPANPIGLDSVDSSAPFNPGCQPVLVYAVSP
ncbi:hypothetical protein CALVIDRAFT_541600 [Calocera viscosa TUFC12733]|uniref:Uncharacterized protein n=1 Tax=Calocera viscosa (strain TUFC12733) TaxID=1330018 RepID=A0A167HJG0_CALVF|nr:hypothetical protein CALVIDRAFT_541600 [Calocera viscosa TUFC12733]